MQSGELPEGGTPTFRLSQPTRRAWPAARRARKCSTPIAPHVRWLIGGSADLAPSTKTLIKRRVDLRRERTRRETSISAFASTRWGRGQWNGACRRFALTVPGFLIFSDYMRASIRLSALMELPAIFVFTHDSIGLGEDGPTHQPIEQLMSLRAIPQLRHSGPRTPTKWPRPGGSSCTDRPSLRPGPQSPGAPDASTAKSTRSRKASAAAPTSLPTQRASRRSSSWGRARRFSSASRHTSN